MKLYQSVGPNPRVVTMFIAEKGVAVPRAWVDIMRGENRQPDYLSRNPWGHTPLLELDDGGCIAESVAICEYLEERHPDPPLIGATAEARAATRMTVRRIDQTVVVPMTIGFRGAEGHGLFKDRLLCVPDAAPGAKALGQDGLAFLDRSIEGSTWLAGERFTLADILLFCFVEFGAQVGQPLSGDLARLTDWRTRVAARPSAAASANPKIGLEQAEAA